MGRKMALTRDEKEAQKIDRAVERALSKEEKERLVREENGQNSEDEEMESEGSE